MVRKLRVYELARHYGVHHKTILDLLHRMKVEAKSHMSVVESENVDTVHSVFERKREIARLNYAKSHGLDPEKLKHVASLKPLERPQPEEEPEPKKKVAKKKKKKKAKAKEPAKKKIVIIKKTGTDTAVTRKAAEKRREAEEAETQRVEEDRLRSERIDAERAAAREEHRKTRLVLKKKLVKKSVEVEEPAEVEVEPAVDAEVETVAEAPTPVEAAAPAATDPVETKAAETQAAPARPARPKRSATAAGKEGKAASVSKESVKASVQAAIRKRQDERAAREQTSPRRKRTRAKKKKVDQAEVDRAVKQTMAQMGGAAATGKRKRRKGGGAVEEVDETSSPIIRITEFITVQELAEKLDVEAREIITKLFALGVMVTINQRLDHENIELLAEEFEREIEFIAEYGEEILEHDDTEDGDLKQRAPVVTVMGHVDHGKTSLLDFIRSTNVIAGEAGSITQHIGAYRVESPGGPITFLDTPGHAAFSAMRARGAQVTDIVILVVAADDRVMPQTVEAINHAKSAGVPIIVAVNKIDLPAAKPDLVKQELAQHGVQIEEYGGDVLCAEISAKHGDGIDRLLELVHLQSEVLELTASPEGNARGTVVEASKEPGRGVVFTVLIERGTLSMGDIFLVGVRDGRIRAMFNERGDELTKIGPSEPAVVLGARDVPQAGDRFYVLNSEREARELAAKRSSLLRQQQLAGPKKKIDLDNLAEMIVSEDLKELPIIIKGDVSGSVEALADQLMQLNTSEVQIRIVHKAVGAISESDVLLAGNTGALIIGFHMRPGAAIKEMAGENHVSIENFDIIYEAVDTLKKAMAGLLGAIEREVAVGSAEVREVFRIPKLGEIAGSHVVKGIIKRNSLIRLVRDEVVIFTGKISSLKRFKDDAKEVQSGFDCGIGLENFQELKTGDMIESYEIEEVARTEL